MFALKKLIGTWLMPLPLLLTFIAVAAILYFLTRFRRTGLGLAALSFTLLVLLSCEPVATRLAATLESQYPGYQQQPVQYIHVLGNGHTTVDSLPITSQLLPASLTRSSEGIRIYRLNPGAKLIFSGYSGGDENSNARMNARFAMAMGVPENDIILLEHPKDTIEEAMALRQVVDNDVLAIDQSAPERLALVTSATHMPRAMQIFWQAGFTPVPAPTGHVGKQASGEKPVYKYLPKAQYLAISERVCHEWLGLAWLALTTTDQSL